MVAIQRVSDADLLTCKIENFKRLDQRRKSVTWELFTGDLLL